MKYIIDLLFSIVGYFIAHLIVSLFAGSCDTSNWSTTHLAACLALAFVIAIVLAFLFNNNDEE